MKLELAPDPRMTRVQTRAGHAARILAYHPEQEYSLIGEVFMDDKWRAATWTKTGKFHAFSVSDNALDLIPAPPEMEEVPVERIAVYVDGDFYWSFKTRELAEKHIAENHVKERIGDARLITLRGNLPVPKQEPQPVVLEGKVSESSVNKTEIVINLHGLGDRKFVGRKCTLTIQ